MDGEVTALRPERQEDGESAGPDAVGALLRLMLADPPDVDAIVAAIKASADVVGWPVDGVRLVRAVCDARNAHDRLVISAASASSEIGALPTLTPREREVLNCVASGLSNKLAARELGISTRTVEVHRARVMEKLGARNAAELMRIVLER